jgi:acetyl esterase/lipase
MGMTDWDDAYDNRGHIENAADFPPKWASKAKAFRLAALANDCATLGLKYGDHERETLDLFHPTGTPKGTLIFVHGGYWKAFDKSFWSHLANGPLLNGWNVSIPSYALAPEVRISEITQQIAKAVAYTANAVDGPIRLSGHSAGGHLVTRMVCCDSSLSPEVLKRIEHIVSISGVHDLRPLLKTRLNGDLQIDDEEASLESPYLLIPSKSLSPNFSLTCWVGENERPEFVRQNELLRKKWQIYGNAIKCVRSVNRHHFNVINELEDANSNLTRELTR